MLKIYKDIAVIKELIEEKILHPFLMQYIESPEIDEDKIFILVSILEEAGLSTHQIHNYSLTTMLIQIALDTHEFVNNSKVDELGQKKRQLTVLAGDYYSGLYYKLLSDLDDISMIRILAEGIKIMNEHKIIVYHKIPDQVDLLMEHVKMDEMALIDKLIKYFKLKDYNEIISNYLLIKRLQKETARYIEGQNSVVFDALHKIEFPKYGTLSYKQKKYLVSICEQYMKDTKILINNLINKHSPINNTINHLIEQILDSCQLMGP